MRFLTITALALVFLAGSTLLGQDRVWGLPKLPGAKATTELPRYSQFRLNANLLSPEAFLEKHVSELGLNSPAELRETSRNLSSDGRTYVRYQQQFSGAPVLGGELILQLNGYGHPRQLSGNLAAPTSFAPATAPQLPDDELEARAREVLVPDYPFARQWNIVDHGDAWAQRNPWATTPGPYYRCRVLEVREPAGALAEMVYLELGSGKEVFRHPLYCSLSRRLNHTNTSSGNTIWTEGDLFPGFLNTEDTEMITATKEVYSLYFRSFGRNSYNGTGGQMRTVTQAAISGCPNARAFNNIILACDGVVGDDIVGHEWTHNYTSNLNGLLFFYESGAIQEALADIFGEAVDLLNDRGLDANDQLRRDSCFSGNYRWSIAEDATAIDTILRDLWAPECKTDPSNRNSSNYGCPTPNGQDIHSNSLLVSRTFALLTDGDTTSVDTVRGIGMTKALHIFYHANANYITRVTDFRALAAMLRQSALDLQGTNLRELTLLNTVALLSNQFITDEDLTSLEAAIAATGLELPALCPNLTALAQDPPSGCEDAPINNLAVLLQTDWESDLAGWEISETPVFPTTWDPKPWRIVSGLPDGRPGSAIFAPNAHVGNCQTDRDNGTVDLTSPEVLLPGDQENFRLTFDHYYSIEEGTDGGRLSISRNEEDFIPIPSAAFIYNGYSGLLEPAVINDNPLAGEAAFTGADPNSLTGTWGTSVVDLTAAGALPYDRIRLRWTLGHDGCDGWLGWYVDNITVAYCGGATLPVEYLSLVATGFKGYVQVNWETAREENNLGFKIERSTENGAFVEVGFVPAGGGIYAFTDDEVLSGVRYFYRLRQIDLDGTESLSPLVSAEPSGDSAILVYPNPAPGAFTIVGAAEVAEVFDLAGRHVTSVALADGFGRVGGLRRGVYAVRVGNSVQRVVVQ